MDVSLRGTLPVYTRMAHDGRHGDNSLLRKHIDADTFICCPVPVDSPVASVRPPPCATARSPRLAISGRQASAVSRDALGLAGLRCQPVATARGLGTQEFPPGSGVPGICRDQHSQPCGERPGLRIPGASECLVSSGLLKVCGPPRCGCGCGAAGGAPCCIPSHRVLGRRSVRSGASLHDALLASQLEHHLPVPVAA